MIKPRDSTHPAHQEPERTSSDTGGHARRWSYEGNDGPEHWGEIDPSYATCRIGQRQSPIDLVNARPQGSADIVFHYHPSRVRILNDGHTVLVNYGAGSHIEVDGRRYEVLQYHFHVPSEHAADGALFAAELHIVHKDADGQLAVVGILIEPGTENTALRPLLSSLPEQEGQENDLGITINAADFLPAVRACCRYNGSLTTPPCTEGVHWVVMTTPVQLSTDQLAVLERVLKGNSRPIQTPKRTL